MKRQCRGAFSIACIFLFLNRSVWAQATVAVPPLGQAPSATVPPISESTLPNGLRILVAEDHRQPVVHLRLILPAGVSQEPPGKAGLSSLLAGTIFRSHAQVHTDLAEKVNASGAQFDADSDADYLEIYVNGVVGHASDYFDLLDDVAERPAFPSHDNLEGKAQYLPAIISRIVASAGSLASIALDRIVYAGLNYASLPTGTIASLAEMSQEDFRSFYSQNFQPSKAVLIVVGDVTDASARAMALKSFGAWKPNLTASTPDVKTDRAAVPVSTAGAKPAILIIDRPGSQQTEIRVGTKISGFGDPARIAGDVAMAVLGNGEFENRLMQEIRVSRGLTYTVKGSFERHRDAGEFAVATYTKNISTGEVVRLILDVVKKLAETPPTAAELADHKSYLDGIFAIGMASTGSFLANLIESVVYEGGPGALANYSKRVDAVTAADVSKVIADLHIESAHIVLVGDAKAIEPQVKDIGTVTVIESNELDLMSPNLRRAGVTP